MDEKLVIEELTKFRVFDYIPGRCHSSFPNIHPSIAEHIDKAKLLKWIQKKKSELHHETTIAKTFLRPPITTCISIGLDEHV